MPMDSDEDFDPGLLEKHFGEKEPQIELSAVANELACLRCGWRVEHHKCSFVCPFCGSSNFGSHPSMAAKSPGCLTANPADGLMNWKQLTHLASDRYRRTSRGRGRHRMMTKHHKAA